MGRVDIILGQLAKAALFEGAVQADLELISKSCKHFKYSKGVEVVQKSHTYEGFYCVAEGEIKLYFLDKDGEEKSAGRIKEGGTFGEVNLFMKQPLPVYGRTKKNTILIYIPRKSILLLLKSSPIVAMQMMALLSQRLYHMTHELEMLCTLSAHERVMHFITTELTSDIVGGDVVKLKDTKAEVAATLHLTPETFSRVMHNLEDDGTISVQGKKIQVHNKQKLELQ